MLTIPKKYIGLDLECTGGELSEHVICQIGICVRTDGGTPLMFKSDVGSDAGSYKWEEAALKVNRFTHERIQAGPRWPEVNEFASTFLTTFAPVPKRLTTVGWAVGSFDLPFVNKESPIIMSRLQRKHVDLTGVTLTLATAINRDASKLKKEIKAWAGKKTIEAFSEFGSADDSWHDAGFDAVASLYAWQWIIDFMRSDKMIAAIINQRLVADVVGDLNAEAEEAQAQES